MSEKQLFLDRLQSLDDYEVQRFFDDRYEGDCLCFSGVKTVAGESLGVLGRCWRVSENQLDLYIGGTLDRETLEQVATIIKRKLEEQLGYGSYTIIYEDDLPTQLEEEEE